jgi:hypothetical protein
MKGGDRQVLTRAQKKKKVAQTSEGKESEVIQHDLGREELGRCSATMEIVEAPNLARGSGRRVLLRRAYKTVLIGSGRAVKLSTALLCTL